MTIRAITDYLPHAGPMVLLDRVLAIAPDHLVAEVVIRADSMFAGDAGVPGWVGLEYMAQAVAALAGCESLARGEAVRPGFLLGTRDYNAYRGMFALGAHLAVSARRIYVAENGITAMACDIRDPAGVLAEATLTVYQPADVPAFLAQST